MRSAPQLGASGGHLINIMPDGADSSGARGRPGQQIALTCENVGKNGQLSRCASPSCPGRQWELPALDAGARRGIAARPHDPPRPPPQGGPQPVGVGRGWARSAGRPRTGGL